ncbi:MAG: MerR family transcriptional regulator [Sciscionella sp.]
MGELARATGLSVRVLRHWDEIGLVSPGRTSAGHRCYTVVEVNRLYRALALRQMGLRLDQVADLLAGAGPSPRETLRNHLERVQADLAARRVLRDRLVEVLDALGSSAAGCANDDAADAALLMKVIEKMTMFDQHLTAEQRTWFTQRREQLGDPAWQEAIDGWPELIAAVRAEMAAGTGPADARVQQLMSRWDRLQRVFLGDSTEMRTAAGRAWQAMWNQHPDELRESSRVAPPDMSDYVQRARDARPGGN